MDGEAVYYGLNALSHNVIMANRKKLKNPNGLFLGVLYMRELGVVGLRQWCGRLPGVQVSMSRPEMSFFPPALESPI